MNSQELPQESTKEQLEREGFVHIALMAAQPDSKPEFPILPYMNEEDRKKVILEKYPEGTEMKTVQEGDLLNIYVKVDKKEE